MKTLTKILLFPITLFFVISGIVGHLACKVVQSSPLEQSSPLDDALKILHKIFKDF